MTRLQPASKQQAIIDAAISLFAQMGLQGTSTAAIAKSARVATGTLFHHFANKEQLIESVFFQIKDEMAHALTLQDIAHLPIRQQAYCYWQQALEWCIENRDKARFIGMFYQSPYYSVDVVAQIHHHLFGFLDRLVVEGQSTGVIKPLAGSLLLEASFGMLMSTAQHIVQQPELQQDHVFMQQAFELVWDAVAVH